MKALSLWQPWATAIALGLKRNETRDWPATSSGQRYRGWLAICAAKTLKDPDKDRNPNRIPLSVDFNKILRESDESALAFCDAGYSASPVAAPWFDRLPFGKVVAIAWLQECVPTEKAAPPIVEKIWGDYGPNRWAWQFTECWRVNQPFDVRGEQKLFDIQAPDQWQNLCTKVY